MAIALTYKEGLLVILFSFPDFVGLSFSKKKEKHERTGEIGTGRSYATIGSASGLLEELEIGKGF